jgi:hypothetical protein
MENQELSPLEYYYEKQDKITKACLLALKAIVLSVDKDIIHTRKYQIPFFRYKDFNLSFLWVHRKKITIGFVEDKKAFAGVFSKPQKDYVITLEINPLEDIPMDLIQHRIKELIRKYNNAKQ